MIIFGGGGDTSVLWMMALVGDTNVVVNDGAVLVGDTN